MLLKLVLQATESYGVFNLWRRFCILDSFVKSTMIWFNMTCAIVCIYLILRPDYLYYVLICKTFDFKEGVLSFYYDWTINIMFLMCLQYKELCCGHCDKDT